MDKAFDVDMEVFDDSYFCTEGGEGLVEPECMYAFCLFHPSMSGEVLKMCKHGRTDTALTGPRKPCRTKHCPI